MEIWVDETCSSYIFQSYIQQYNVNLSLLSVGDFLGVSSCLQIFSIQISTVPPTFHSSIPLDHILRMAIVELPPLEGRGRNANDLVAWVEQRPQEDLVR